MSIHYKFKSSKNYDTIVFDAQHISVMELKQRILAEKYRMDPGACPDDLLLTDANTNQDYENDYALIPKNTSLIVTRQPGIGRRRQPKTLAQPTSMASTAPIVPALPAPTQPGMTEAERLNATLTNSMAAACTTLASHAKMYARRPVGGVGGGGLDAGKRPKQPTGIPRSLLKPVNPNEEGAMKLDDGTYVTFAPTDPASQPPPSAPHREPVPDELACPVCSQLLRSAVSVPCCSKVFCEECIRNALTSTAACPACKRAGISCDALTSAKDVRRSITEHLRRLKNPELYAANDQNNTSTDATIDTTTTTPAPAKQRGKSRAKRDEPSRAHYGRSDRHDQRFEIDQQRYYDARYPSPREGSPSGYAHYRSAHHGYHDAYDHHHYREPQYRDHHYYDQQHYRDDRYPPSSSSSSSSSASYRDYHPSSRPVAYDYPGHPPPSYRSSSSYRDVAPSPPHRDERPPAYRDERPPAYRDERPSAYRDERPPAHRDDHHQQPQFHHYHQSRSDHHDERERPDDASRAAHSKQETPKKTDASEPDRKGVSPPSSGDPSTKKRSGPEARPTLVIDRSGGSRRIVEVAGREPKRQRS